MRHCVKLLFRAEFLTLVVGLLGLILMSFGAAVPIFSLHSLTEQSNIIVIARVGTFQKVEEVPISVHGQVFKAEVMEASANVRSVLKGAFSEAKLKVRFSLPISPAGSVGYGTVPGQQNRVLFLKNAAAGSYEVTDPYYPSLPAAENLNIPAGVSTEDQVASVECATVASLETNPEQRAEAIGALKGRTDPCISDALLVGFNSFDQRLRLSASAALLKRNEIGILSPTVQEIIKLPPSSYLRLNILSAIRDGVKDERGIPSLKQMMGSSDAMTRRAAASALRHIGSSLCVVPLAEALDDPDKDTRYYAVVGLAELENQLDEKPSMEDFDNDESRFLLYWKAWAKVNVPVSQREVNPLDRLKQTSKNQ
jgi:HEAT repeats